MPAPLGNKNGKQFQKGNKAATKNKGKKQRRTIIREQLGLADPEKLERLKLRLDELTTEFLYSKDRKTRENAHKELLKYVHPQKKTLDISGQQNIKMEIYLPKKSPLGKPENVHVEDGGS